MKYVFDNIEEYREAMKHLENYHNCNKSHGNIVCIQPDGFGNTRCAYCGANVLYPRMSKELFKKILKELKV